jgi:hypothetical protein
MNPNANWYMEIANWISLVSAGLDGLGLLVAALHWRATKAAPLVAVGFLGMLAAAIMSRVGVLNLTRNSDGYYQNLIAANGLYCLTLAILILGVALSFRELRSRVVVAQPTDVTDASL